MLIENWEIKCIYSIKRRKEQHHRQKENLAANVKTV